MFLNFLLTSIFSYTLDLIFLGVPRGKRGEVWQFLAERYCAKVAPLDTSKYPNYNVCYDTLLKQLTSHQHAILIDLGTITVVYFKKRFNKN